MSKLKNILIVLVPALITFPLSRIIWKDPLGAMPPTAHQLSFFILLGIGESLVFGAGVLFLLKGYKWLSGSGASRNLVVWTYVAIAWSLLSWWPHDNIHRANGMDMQGLLYIEYGFHLTLMVAAVIIAYFFMETLKNKQQQV